MGIVTACMHACVREYFCDGEINEVKILLLHQLKLLEVEHLRNNLAMY